MLTGHRRESFAGGLARIASAIGRIALRPDVAIIFPVHPNLNVGRAFGPLSGYGNIRLIEPIDYPELLYLLKRCHLWSPIPAEFKEAPSIGKPVLVTRETIERPEAMEPGCAKLVGTDEQRLFEAMCALPDDADTYQSMSQVVNPYGDGQASARIAERLKTKA